MFLCGSTSMVRWNMSENIAALLASLLLMIAPIGPNQDGFNATDFDACAYIDSVDAMICELESALRQGDAQLALRLSDVEMLDLVWNELRCAHMYACDGDVTFIKNLDGSLDVLIDIRYTVGYELMRALGAGPAYSYSAPDAPLELESVDVDGLELTQRQRDTLERALEVLDELELDGLDAYERELAIHDWLVENVTYDDEADDCQDAYGALIGGRAHCMGYSDAFYLLGTLAGLDVNYISGYAYGGGHAWNTVRLDGRSYFVDVTWDDEDWGAPLHSYFNIPSPALYSSHSYADRHVPTDIAGKYDSNNYFFREGLTVETTSQAYAMMLDALAAGETRIQLASDNSLELHDPSSELEAALSERFGDESYMCYGSDMGGLNVYDVWLDGYDEYREEMYGDLFDDDYDDDYYYGDGDYDDGSGLSDAGSDADGVSDAPADEAA